MSPACTWRHPGCAGIPLPLLQPGPPCLACAVWRREERHSSTLDIVAEELRRHERLSMSAFTCELQASSRALAEIVEELLRLGRPARLTPKEAS